MKTPKNDRMNQPLEAEFYYAEKWPGQYGALAINRETRQLFLGDVEGDDEIKDAVAVTAVEAGEWYLQAQKYCTDESTGDPSCIIEALIARVQLLEGTATLPLHAMAAMEGARVVKGLR